MLSLSLNTPPQAQLEALRALRLFGSGPSWLHAIPASAVASSGSGFPSWVHSRSSDPVSDFASASDSPSFGCRGFRISSARVELPMFPHESEVPALRFFGVFRTRLQCFRSSRYSDCLVFRYFPDESDLRLFFVPVFSGIPAFFFSEFRLFVVPAGRVGIPRSIDPSGRHLFPFGPSQLPCCHDPDASSASF
jgi:hypothetical protein